MKPASHIVISLSGGMDSSTLLLNCINEVGAKNITALSFDYGQKHRVELERATSLVDYLASKGYEIKHQIIKLDGLTELLNSSLVDGGPDVPEGHYAQDNMKATVVPNRNKIFASIVQAVALSVATQKQINVAIALGIHAGDHAIYPDCRQEFRDADDDAFRIGNWDAHLVEYYTPYLYQTKFDILTNGRYLCNKMGLDFNEVYKRTNTSYKPIFIDGTWYADYKSASSVERVESFIKLGVPDPAAYADETGVVTWDKVVAEVQSVLDTYSEASQLIYGEGTNA